MGEESQLAGASTGLRQAGNGFGWSDTSLVQRGVPAEGIPALLDVGLHGVLQALGSTLVCFGHGAVTLGIPCRVCVPGVVVQSPRRSTKAQLAMGCEGVHLL